MQDVIKKVLMERDAMEEAEADSLLEDARNTLDHLLEEGDISGAMEICEECFGLEEDYILDLIDYY